MELLGPNRALRQLRCSRYSKSGGRARPCRGAGKAGYARKLSRMSRRAILLAASQYPHQPPENAPFHGGKSGSNPLGDAAQ